MRDLVTVFSCSDQMRAQEIASLLEEEGFDPVITGGTSNAVFGNIMGSLNPIRVMVEADDEEVVRALLKGYLEGDPVVPPGELEEQPAEEGEEPDG